MLAVIKHVLDDSLASQQHSAPVHGMHNIVELLQWKTITSFLQSRAPNMPKMNSIDYKI